MEFDDNPEASSLGSLYDFDLEHADVGIVDVIESDIRTVMTRVGALTAELPLGRILNQLHFIEEEIAHHGSEHGAVIVDTHSEVGEVLDGRPKFDLSESRIESPGKDLAELHTARDDLMRAYEHERVNALESLFRALGEYFDHEALRMIDDEDLNQEMAQNLAQEIYRDIEARSDITLQTSEEDFKTQLTAFLRLRPISQDDMDETEFGEERQKVVDFMAWAEGVGGSNLASHFRHFFDIDYSVEQLRENAAPMENYWRLQILYGKQRRDAVLGQLIYDLGIEEGEDYGSPWNRALREVNTSHWMAEKHFEKGFGELLTREVMGEYISDFPSLEMVVQGKKGYRSIFRHGAWELFYRAMGNSPRFVESVGEDFLELNDRMIMQTHRDGIISSDPVDKEREISCGYTMFDLGTKNPQVGADHASMLLLNAYRQMGHSGGFPFLSQDRYGSTDCRLSCFFDSLDISAQSLPSWVREAHRLYMQDGEVLQPLYSWNDFRRTLWQEREIDVPLLPPPDFNAQSVQDLLARLPEARRERHNFTDADIDSVRARVQFLECVYQGCVECLQSDDKAEVVFGLQTLEHLDFPMSEETYQIINDFLDQHEAWSPELRRIIVNLGHRNDYFSHVLALRCMAEIDPDSDNQEDFYDIPRIIANLADSPEFYPVVVPTIAQKLGVSEPMAQGALERIVEIKKKDDPYFHFQDPKQILILAHCSVNADLSGVLDFLSENYPEWSLSDYMELGSGLMTYPEPIVAHLHAQRSSLSTDQLFKISKLLTEWPEQSDVTLENFDLLLQLSKSYQVSAVVSMYAFFNNQELGVAWEGQKVEFVSNYLSLLGLFRAPFILGHFCELMYGTPPTVPDAVSDIVSQTGVAGIRQLKQAIERSSRNFLSDDPPDPSGLSDFDKAVARYLVMFDTSAWSRPGISFDSIVDHVSEPAVREIPEEYDTESGITLQRIQKGMDELLEQFKEPYDAMVSLVMDARRFKTFAIAQKAILTELSQEIDTKQAIADDSEGGKQKALLAQKQKAIDLEDKISQTRDLSGLLTAYLESGYKIEAIDRIITLYSISVGLEHNEKWQEYISGVLESRTLTQASYTRIEEFFTQYMSQDVLGSDSEIVDISQLSKRARKRIKPLFSIGEAGAFHRAMEELETDEYPGTLSFMPDRGVLGECAGYVGEACYTRQFPLLKERPNLIPIMPILEENEERELSGSNLCFEVTANQGEKCLLLRAVNPNDRLLDKVTTSSYCLAFIEYAKKVAKARGISRVIAPDGSGVISNRPGVTTFFQDYLNNSEEPEVGDTVKLDEPFDFNGYNITERCRTVAVIE